MFKSEDMDCDGHKHDGHGDAVERACMKMPNIYMLNGMADFFRMFSDSTRIRILWALEDGEMQVCCIAELLDMSVSAVSHQLRNLKDARLVKSRREGRNIIYSLDDDHVKQILDMAYEHITE